MPTIYDIDYAEIKREKPIEVNLTLVSDLLRETSPEFRWVIDDLLIFGGFSLLCGKPKSGKSSLARCLGIAVTRGQQFLGRNTERRSLRIAGEPLRLSL